MNNKLEKIANPLQGYMGYLTGKTSKRSESILNKLEKEYRDANINSKHNQNLYNANKNLIKDTTKRFKNHKVGKQEKDMLKHNLIKVTRSAKYENAIKDIYDKGKQLHKKIKNKQLATRVGTGVGGAALLGASAYGAKKLYDKRKEKTAFEIINESYEKIAR